MTIAPGEEVEVPDNVAEAMVSRNPQKFALVEEAKPERAVTEAPNRMQRGGRTR